jgi:tRNA threonylcarbamoyladenosine biosynthesis protein TsaB
MVGRNVEEITMLLHIETSTKVCSVALSRKGQLVAEKTLSTQEYSHSENLTIFIQEIMDSAQIGFDDLEAVSVTSGPGSYTGLRIGVSTAKGICYAKNIPLISVDALLSLAVQIELKYPNSNYCSVIDARRMEVFSAIYNGKLEVVKPISADIINENSYAQYGKIIVAGDATDKLKEVWKERKDILFDEEIEASAIGQIPIAQKKFKNQEFEDVAYFEPFYLKDFVGSGGK